MPQADSAEKATDLRGEGSTTTTNSPANTETKPKRDRAQYLPQNYVAKNGLPLTPGPKTSFTKFIEYWRKLNAEQRTHVTVAAYQLVPVFRFPEQEHSVMEWPGETPLGGETGSPEEALLNQLGLGDYFLIMRYDGKEILRAWLQGNSDNLPGFRDYKNHPPLHWRSIEYVDLTDAKNIKCGFVGYLKSIGAAPGSAGERPQEDMAETAANTSAVGVLGRIAEHVITDRNQAAAAPTPPQPVSQPEWDTIQKTIDTVDKIHEKHAVNPVELFKTAADMFKQPERPDTTTPLVAKMLEQNGQLQASISDMHKQRLDESREEMKELRRTTNSLLERLLTARDSAAVASVTTVQPTDDPVTAAAKQLIQRKMEAWISNDDDTPRRRRNSDDDDEPPAPQVPFWQTLITTGLQNAPAILSGLMGLLHNASVLKTGEGTTIPPPPTSHNPTAPVGYLNGPAGAPGVADPRNAAAANPSQSQEGNPQMLEALAFLRKIEPALLRSLEQNETGYEFAETFIKAFGRTGEYGYNNLKVIGNTPLANMQEPEETRSINALAKALSMYPPLWQKIGNDSRLHDFLGQFLGYDDLLQEAGQTALMKAMFEYEVDTVPDLLQVLAEEESAGDNNGGNGDDPDDQLEELNLAGDNPDGASGTVIDIPSGNSTPAPASKSPRKRKVN